ncbi:MAG: tetratricopeptide repeat protein [Quisquiliibacterium sp.]
MIKNPRPRSASGLAARTLIFLAVAASLAGCAIGEKAGRSAKAQASESGPGQPLAQRVGSPAKPDSPRAGGIEHEDASTGPPPQELTPKILFQYLAAEVAAQRGERGSAGATFLSLARETRDPRMARRATELLLAERSMQQAMQAAQLWSEIAPQSLLAKQTLEMLLLGANRLAEAEPLLRARRDQARKDDSLDRFYRQLQRSLLRVPDHQAALDLFDRLAAEDSKLPEARQVAAELARAADKPDRAAAEARSAYALNPDEPSAAVTAARFLSELEQGRRQASELLDEFLKRHPDAIEARFEYARLLARMSQPEAAREQMEIALKTEPNSAAILFFLAQLAYQAKDLDNAELYLLRYSSLPDNQRRDNGPAYVFLAQIEQERKQPDKALAWLEKITDGEQFLPAVIERARLTSRGGRLDQARKLLQETAVSTRRERIRLVAAEAQLLREAKDPQQAFMVLDKALVDMPGESDLLYDHAMAAERLDRIDLMESSLRKLIALSPDNAHAYNALGYTFADRNTRLDEALALIEKALELAPHEPHIIDSMGWVLFRRGLFDRAVEQLEKAFALKPEAEIAVHLGEVLWTMGRTEDARRRFAQAREIDPDSEILRETLVRLKIKF